jgi:hypothetical protein
MRSFAIALLANASRSLASRSFAAAQQCEALRCDAIAERGVALPLPGIALPSNAGHCRCFDKSRRTCALKLCRNLYKENQLNCFQVKRPKRAPRQPRRPKSAP